MLVLSPSELRRHAALVWRHRAASEKVSSARFFRLAAALARQGVPGELVGRARSAGDDETRHAQLCAAHADLCAAQAELSAAAAGQVLEEPSMVVPPQVLTPARLATRDEVLTESFAFCALSETLNATLLSVTLQHAADEQLQALVRTLLADEVQHARLGWAHLAFERARGPCAVLATRLVPLLQEAISPELLARKGDTAQDPEALGLGILSPALRLDLIAATLRDVIFPGLESAGVDVAGARTWASLHL